MSDRLHIVCLDAPSPPDYGGAIDMFYKVQALAKLGWKITLHYFDYNPFRNAKGIEKDCVAVYIYKRKSLLQAPPIRHPFIVASRENRDLIKRLNDDHNPVLLEGLHNSGIVSSLNSSSRVVLRMHNDEQAYYRRLANTERNVLRRAYFLQESNLLRRYQQTLNKELRLARLSEEDRKIFEMDYGFQRTNFIPCFIPWQKLAVKEGFGKYCLYHGNMSVSENQEAALWLVKNVFCHTKLPLVIAGKGISKTLLHEACFFKNITLVNNPTIAQIDDLVQNAHINVLPSLNSTGVKLKLLNALFNGRHCITNFNGVKGSRVEAGVTVTENAGQWIEHIETLMNKPFTDHDKEVRSNALYVYKNEENARKLSALW